MRLTARLRRRGEGSNRAASRLEAGLGRLSPEERTCLLLRERLGLSVEEIALVTGLERERVNRELLAARERLAAFLPGEDTRLGD